MCVSFAGDTRAGCSICGGVSAEESQGAESLWEQPACCFCLMCPGLSAKEHKLSLILKTSLSVSLEMVLFSLHL